MGAAASAQVRALPLNSHPVERAVLGVLLMGWHEEGRSLAQEREVTKDWFYNTRHQRIFAAISDLYEMGVEVSPVNVIDRLRSIGTGQSDHEWDMYLYNLPDVVVTTASLAYNLDILDGYKRSREAQALLSESLAELHPFGLNEQLETLTTSLQDLHNETEERESRPARLITDLMRKIQSDEGELLGLSTPWSELSALLVSLTPGALVLVGGRPSMGKTALALQMASHVAEERPVALFSLEMSSEQLMMRWLASESRVSSGRIRRARAELRDDDMRKMLQATARISDSKMRIFDTPSMTPASIRAKCIELHREEPLGLVVVDYLQLMTTGGKEEHRRAEIEAISRALKLLAKELKCPVLALSQLSRALESRADRRPTCSDLRESGALEQDADAVLFVYRDEVYHPESEDRNTAEIILAKQRDGGLGTVRLEWHGETTRFANLPNKWTR